MTRPTMAAAPVGATNGAPGTTTAANQRSPAEKLSIAVRSAIIAFALFAFLAWIVGLAGMAALSHNCHKFDTWGGCARSLQYEWWGIWFEFFLLIWVLVVSFSDKLYVNQLSLLTFLAICTMVLMWSARSCMVGFDYISTIQGYAGPKNCAAAGFVMLCIFNFLIIFFLSWVDRLGVANHMGAAGQGHGKDGNKGHVTNVVAVPGRPSPGTVILPGGMNAV